MKLVVFAHVPPPFHGQSFMVQQLLDELRENGGDDIEVFHVDARLSRDIDDIASASLRKLILLLRYCFRAIWLRIRRAVPLTFITSRRRGCETPFTATGL